MCAKRHYFINASPPHREEQPEPVNSSMEEASGPAESSQVSDDQVDPS